jgi:hypothetical protein
MRFSENNIDKYNSSQTTNYNLAFSAWFRGQGLVNGGLIGSVELIDYLGTTLQTNAISATAVSASTWVQSSFSSFYSGTGTVAGVVARIYATGSLNTNSFIGDGWQIENTASVLDYFDGNYNPYISSASTAYEVAWSGISYESASGLLTSVASAVTAPAVYSFADANSQSTFAGTAIPFTDLQVVYASEQLYNSIQVVGLNATAVVEDTVSQSLYGIRDYSQTDNLTTSTTKPARIASAFLGEFRLPEYRAEQLTIALESLTTAQQTIVLGIELRDVIRVAFKPSNSGSSVDKYYQVLGISSNSDVERDAVTFTLASLDNLSFRLDSTFLGVLDTDTLA